MLSDLALFALLASPALSSLIPRDLDPQPPFQKVPSQATSRDPNQYTRKDVDKTVTSDRYYHIDAEPPNNQVQPPVEYQSRPIDIPFALLSFGKLNFFKNGQFATPAPAHTDAWDPDVSDFANNSACGIPNNAYWIDRVAIHPYWLKYAPADLGLSRYCMQDVCLSIWNETGTNTEGNSDVQFKVTDICSTDPKDPSYCETPSDIMVDRRKAMQLYSNMTKGPTEQEALKKGKNYPHPVYWFFSKCHQDGLTQELYNTTENWWANPSLPLNTGWAMSKTLDQQHKNIYTGAYKAAGLPEYLNGAWRKTDADRASKVFDISKDWKKGDKEPEWCPVAGGKGHGKPTGKHCGGQGRAKVDVE